MNFVTDFDDLKKIIRKLQKQTSSSIGPNLFVGLVRNYFKLCERENFDEYWYFSHRSEFITTKNVKKTFLKIHFYYKQVTFF